MASVSQPVPPAPSDARPHVVIVGAGFAGIECAKALKRAPVRVTLIDKQNHHLFQPLLYQVATAGLAAPDIATPVRQIFRHQDNVTVLLDEVLDVDRAAKQVTLAQGGPLGFDKLVVAAGATHTYFGNDAWEAHAPGLKTLADAFEIRRRILSAFEHAEAEPDAARRKALLTFAIVGAGPTGVELAGAIAEIARQTLAQEFRRFDPRDAHIVLLEGGPRVLSTYTPHLSTKAAAQLADLGVDVRTGARVTHVDDAGVRFTDADGADVTLPARTVLWGAGVAGAAIGRALGDVHRSGRVPVTRALHVAGDPDVFVAGDLALLADVQPGADADTAESAPPVPAVAPAAIQMGKHVAANIARAATGAPDALRPFFYKDKGSLATIGRSRAIGQIAGAQLSGIVAWLAWLFVHLMFLVGFRNRLAVLFDWAWAYFSYQRSARVIMAGKPAPARLPAPPTQGPRRTPTSRDAGAPKAQRVPHSTAGDPRGRATPHAGRRAGEGRTGAARG